jgi:tRNA(Arg) A34 adenosine deaminase TadA
MSRISKFLQLACEEASKSSMYFRHGALVVKGGKVMALGKNSSEQIKHGERYCSIHSEIDAMSRFECGFKEEGEK